MRITKFGHSCVRVEHDGQVVVLDPGSWSERESVDGATAVLITHEHPDHLSPENLRATDAPVYTIAAVASALADTAPDVRERVTVVEPGEHVDVGLPVTAVGELHAVIHPEMQRFFNSGYLLELGERTLYHPGDALTPPPRDVDVMFLPVQAPWSKISEVMDFARSVSAPMSVAIHDGLLNDNGLGLVGRMLSGALEGHGGYQRVAPGSEVTLG
jgi:L-ascorbate metabolism protein UlaG (beta-lactamase superfamily)